MSNIVQPNGQPAVLDVQLQRAPIGGLPVDYQPNPSLVVAVKPEQAGMQGMVLTGPRGEAIPVFVIANPDPICNMLAMMMNLQNALVREVITLRSQLESVSTKVDNLAEGTLSKDDFVVVPDVVPDAEVD